MAPRSARPPDRIVLMGATGDLVMRHTLPAAARLLEGNGLPPGLTLLGLGREHLTVGEYRDRAARRLEQHVPEVAAPVRQDLVASLDYRQTALDQRPDLGALLGDRPVVAYLALPPARYPDALATLQRSAMAPGSRVVIEKPFGEDLASARSLNATLAGMLPERDIFRVDHFLHHQVVQDLLALRLGTPMLATAWSREHIEAVEIVWEEAGGLRGRADYYDRTGALRDMIQSHLLQVLALLTMEVPDSFEEHSLRGARAAALKRVRAPGPGDVGSHTVRGRYTAGVADGRPVPGYVDEPGVVPGRGTETYAGVRLAVDSPRWRGVHFRLSTGKAVGSPQRRISVRFRAKRSAMLVGAPDVLALEIAPDRLALQVAAAGDAGLRGALPVLLTAERPTSDLPPSARILRDVLAGDPSFTLGGDEAEECWRITEAVLAGWEQGRPPLRDYQAGSHAPTWE